MREVLLRVQLTSPALGAARRIGGRGQVVFAFLRQPDGRIAIHELRWRSAAIEAATVAGLDQDAVTAVSWDTGVDGAVTYWNRHFPRRAGGGSGGYARHEALAAGTTVAVRCLLPDALSETDFQRLMEIAGRYHGISPFRPAEFGRFRVLDVRAAAAVVPGQ